MERGLSILWIDAICGSVQNAMPPPENNPVRRVGKPTLYERVCHRPIVRHHWLKQSARQYLDPDLQAQPRRTAGQEPDCLTLLPRPIVPQPFAAGS
jgi:hypothetical protein